MDMSTVQLTLLARSLADARATIARAEVAKQPSALQDADPAQPLYPDVVVELSAVAGRLLTTDS